MLSRPGKGVSVRHSMFQSQKSWRILQVESSFPQLLLWIPTFPFYPNGSSMHWCLQSLENGLPQWKNAVENLRGLALLFPVRNSSYSTLLQQSLTLIVPAWSTRCMMKTRTANNTTCFQIVGSPCKNRVPVFQPPQMAGRQTAWGRQTALEAFQCCWALQGTSRWLTFPNHQYWRMKRS